MNWRKEEKSIIWLPFSKRFEVHIHYRGHNIFEEKTQDEPVDTRNGIIRHISKHFFMVNRTCLGTGTVEIPCLAIAASASSTSVGFSLSDIITANTVMNTCSLFLLVSISSSTNLVGQWTFAGSGLHRKIAGFPGNHFTFNFSIQCWLWKVTNQCPPRNPPRAQVVQTIESDLVLALLPHTSEFHEIIRVAHYHWHVDRRRLWWIGDDHKSHGQLIDFTQFQPGSSKTLYRNSVTIARLVPATLSP